MPTDGKKGPLSRGPKKGAKEGTRTMKKGKPGMYIKGKKGKGK